MDNFNLIRKNQEKVKIKLNKLRLFKKDTKKF